jgi:hypothetical protein
MNLNFPNLNKPSKTLLNRWQTRLHERHHIFFTFMTKRILLSSAAIGVFGTLFFYLTPAERDVQAQKTARVVEKTVLVKKAEESVTRFASAAAENSRLRNSLQWAFGGKTQIGWNIYVPLISHTLGADSAPNSEEFALTVSKWQGRNGLTATGILDRETLESFTKYWQSRRLGRAGLSSADSLVTAPIAEFWDPSRSPDLLQLERETYAAYKRMIAAAAEELGADLLGGRFLKIVSSYRSPAYQEALRKREPSAGRAALAKHSPHSTGHALDIYVGGEPVKTEDSNRLLQVQTPAYKWLVKNAEKFGFYPYFYEPWHWEYVPAK